MSCIRAFASFPKTGKLDNIIYFIDNNGYQLDGKTDDILAHGDMAKKVAGFGLHVQEIDGHDVKAIYDAIQRRFNGRKRNDTLYLQCGNCGARMELFDDDLLAEVERQTAEYTPPEPSGVSYEPSSDVVRLTNAINRGLEKPDQTEEIVKLILQGVSARYDCFSRELDPIDIHGEGAIQYITISADNAVTVTFKG